MQLQFTQRLAESLPNEFYLRSIVFFSVKAQIVLVTDDEMAAAATILFSELKLALEPAGAASTAGALGPLKDKIKDKRVGVIISGTNTDPNSYKELIDRGIKSLKNGVFNYN